MQKEIDFLGNAVNNPERPFVAILGGAKVSSKISVINNLLDKVDTLIIGGGMSYTFSKAMGGHIGKSLCEDDYLQYALDMMKKAEEKGVKLLLPVDNRIGDDFSNDCNIQIVKRGEIPDGWEGMDIGTETEKILQMLLKMLRQLYGTDRWDASRCRTSHMVQRQLPKLLQRQTQQRSSVAVIQQQL